MRIHTLGILPVFLLAALFAHATTYYVAPGGNDGNPGTSASPFATIQKASNVAVAGDTIDVRPGTYVGAKFATSGTSSLPITVHGETGAIVNAKGPLNSNSDNLWIRDASYIIIEGFEVTAAPRAGIAVQGEPTAEAHGIVLRNNFCHNNSRWGIFSGYAEGIHVQNNETSYSGTEHGIYVSNSSDNPVISGNRSHHNYASGIQINADPALPGDGIISNALIDSNIIYENGVGGAAGINLASVTFSVIRNNLLYNNHAGGIAGWDDGDGTQWGTHNDKFLNNTIVQPSDGRFVISFLNGSTNNQVNNNILLHLGTRGSINVDSTSEPGLNSDYNVVVNVFSYNDGSTFISLSSWQARGHDAHSFISTTSALFVNSGANDYHLKSGSPAIDKGITVTDVLKDLDGNSRPQGSAYDIGAYEFTGGGGGRVYLFTDDFEDGNANGWTFPSGTWSVVTGDLTGSGKAAQALSPAFSGCGNCTIEADLRIVTTNGRASLFGWWLNSNTYVEMKLLDDKNTVQLTQLSAGTQVATKSAATSISSGTTYHLMLKFDGTSFQAYINGTLIITMAPGVTPSGKVGFGVSTAKNKAVTGKFPQIVVYQ